jgi:hypothetical protein
MNNEHYKKMLNGKLLPFMGLHKTKYFLQDGAPCHNQIENCWVHIKNMVAKKDVGSVPNMSEAIKQVWVTEISPEYLKKLSDSMLDRLKAVIAAKGDTTKY